MTVETKDRTKFVMIPKWIMLSDLSSGAIRLYGALMSYANNETLQAFPSRKTLANDMHMKQAKSIDPYIDELREFGALKVEKRLRKDGGHMSSLYTLVFDDPSIEAEGVVPENGQGGGSEGTLTTLTEPTLNSSTPPSPAMEKPLTPSPSGKDTTPLHVQLGISQSEAQYLMDLAVAFYNTGTDIESDAFEELEEAFEALTGFYVGNAIANKGFWRRLGTRMAKNPGRPRYGASQWLGELRNTMNANPMAA